jgi:hypothetical protein
VMVVLSEMMDISKLGYFCTDNATPNDVAIKTILARLRPDVKKSETHRVRCLSHIINLAAMPFLFGKRFGLCRR